MTDPRSLAMRRFMLPSIARGTMSRGIAREEGAGRLFFRRHFVRIMGSRGYRVAEFRPFLDAMVKSGQIKEIRIGETIAYRRSAASLAAEADLWAARAAQILAEFAGPAATAKDTGEPRA